MTEDGKLNLDCLLDSYPQVTASGILSHLRTFYSFHSWWKSQYQGTGKSPFSWEVIPKWPSLLPAQTLSRGHPRATSLLCVKWSPSVSMLKASARPHWLRDPSANLGGREIAISTLPPFRPFPWLFTSPHRTLVRIRKRHLFSAARCPTAPATLWGDWGDPIQPCPPPPPAASVPCMQHTARCNSPVLAAGFSYLEMFSYVEVSPYLGLMPSLVHHVTHDGLMNQCPKRFLDAL